VAWVHERTIPTERPPLVGEVSTKFCRERVPSGQRDGSLRLYSWISRPAFLYITKWNSISRGDVLRTVKRSRKNCRT
jgi:hypothetical protein